MCFKGSRVFGLRALDCFGPGLCGPSVPQRAFTHMLACLPAYALCLLGYSVPLELPVSTGTLIGLVPIGSWVHRSAGLFGPQGPWSVWAQGSGLIWPWAFWTQCASTCLHAYASFPHMLSSFWDTQSRWSSQCPLGHWSVWSQLDPGPTGVLDCLGPLCLVVSRLIGLWAAWAH